MALVFEYTKDLETGIQPFISHEKDSVLYNYYVAEELALDKRATAPLGWYDNVVFANEERSLTTKAVSKIGIKNFPGVGGIGFYRDAYSDESLIAAPIHIKRELVGVPTLTTVEIVNNKLHIVITPPDSVNYACYRVVVRQGTFAFEYITYKVDCLVDMPTVKGTYTCYCFGYDEANGTVGDNSNELSLTVTVGSDSWEPYYETVSDLEHRVTDLEADTDALIEMTDDLTQRVTDLEADVGDIGRVLDEINGVEV